MGREWPENEVDVKWNSYRRAMEPVKEGGKPETPAWEEMQTWDTGQAAAYYRAGGEEP